MMGKKNNNRHFLRLLQIVERRAFRAGSKLSAKPAAISASPTTRTAAVPSTGPAAKPAPWKWPWNRRYGTWYNLSGVLLDSLDWDNFPHSFCSRHSARPAGEEKERRRRRPRRNGHGRPCLQHHRFGFFGNRLCHMYNLPAVCVKQPWQQRLDMVLSNRIWQIKHIRNRPDLLSGRLL